MNELSKQTTEIYRNVPLEAIREIADTYDIRLANAARVFEGEGNASVDRGYYDHTTDDARDVPTVDELAAGDKIQWMYSLYEVVAIGRKLSDVPGRHVELKIVDSAANRYSMDERHTIHARLINRWLDLERETFYVVPRDREVSE